MTEVGRVLICSTHAPMTEHVFRLEIADRDELVYVNDNALESLGQTIATALSFAQKVSVTLIRADSIRVSYVMP